MLLSVLLVLSMLQSSFLLEIYTEETPIWSQNKENYRAFFKKILTEYNIDFHEQIKVFVSLYRVIIYLPEISDTTSEIKKNIKGPKIENLEAVSSFAKKYDIDKKDLQTKDGFVFYNQTIHGVKSNIALKNMIEHELQKYSFKKSMVWNESQVSWVRPIRSILALYNNDILDITFAGIKSSDIVYVHKYLDASLFKKVSSFERYQEYLEENNIIFCDFQRKKKIIEKLNEIVDILYFAVPQNKLDLFADNLSKSSEYIYLEYIQIELPDEFLKENLLLRELYQEVVESEGMITIHNFVIFGLNIMPNDDIKADYLNLINSRLHDVLFLFNLDQGLDLEKSYLNLKNINFYGEKSSIFDQSVRMEKIAKFIWPSNKELIKAAKMYLVGMNSYLYSDYSSMLSYISYNLTQNKFMISKEIKFIHNIDTLVNLFAIGKRVTPSKDLYGMRKISFAILDFALNFDVNLQSIVNYIESLISSDNENEIINFIITRLKFKIDNCNDNVLCSIKDIVEFDNLTLFLNTYEKIAKLYQESSNTLSILYRLEKICLSMIAEDLSLLENVSVNQKLLTDKEEKVLFLAYEDLVFQDLLPLIENMLNNCKINVEDKATKTNRTNLIYLCYQKGLKELGLKKAVV